MYLEHYNLYSLVDYIGLSNKTDKIVIPKGDIGKIRKKGYSLPKISNSIMKGKKNSELNYISKLKALEKVDFLKFNSNSRIFNEVIKNSEYNRNLIRKSVDLSYLIKPKPENNLFQFKMYLKESSVKPFNFLKTSKSSLFSINQNIPKTIDELNIIKRRNNQAERIQNKSCSLNNHFNLNKGDSIGRNFHKSCQMKDTIGKESTSKIGFLSEVEKTLELKIFNTKKTSFKPPNFENNKLFIALGKSTFLKKKLN